MAAISLTSQGTGLSDSVCSLLDYSWYAQPILRKSTASSVAAVERAGTSGRVESSTISRVSVAGMTSGRTSRADERSTSRVNINGKPGIERRCTMSESEMRAVFKKFDDNGDGLISEEELQKYMRCCGTDVSDTQAHGMISSVDLNKDGSVDFEEFLSLYQTEDSGAATGGDDEKDHRKEDEEAALLGAFRVFDRDRDGFISVKELQAVLLSLGMPEGKSLISCERMIRKVDRDGDGRCNIREFQEMMSANSFEE